MGKKPSKSHLLCVEKAVETIMGFYQEGTLRYLKTAQPLFYAQLKSTEHRVDQAYEMGMVYPKYRLLVEQWVAMYKKGVLLYRKAERNGKNPGEP